MDYNDEECNQTIYSNGTQLALLDSPQKIMNKFVIELQEKLNSYGKGDVIDWH